MDSFWANGIPNILLGIGVLFVSFYMGRLVIRQAYRQLSSNEYELLKKILHDHFPFQLIPLGLLLVYLVTRLRFPEYNLHIILTIWIVYNIFLWFKMRWFMKRFRTDLLPPSFQTHFILGQILFYTGLVVAMLILSRGENL